MKKRIVGQAALTHVDGDCADAPAGSDSEDCPSEPVAAYVSLPETIWASPVSDHGAEEAADGDHHEFAPVV